jgi:hypothetical protein
MAGHEQENEQRERSGYRRPECLMALGGCARLNRASLIRNRLSQSWMIILVWL